MNPLARILVGSGSSSAAKPQGREPFGHSEFQETKTPLTPRMVGTGVIVFAHANGFPAGAYREMLDYWRNAGWIVLAPDMMAHDPSYPVTNGWESLRDELLDFITEQVPGMPVVLVGHDLGGYLCLLAASHRPELARGVILLDTPLIHGWRARSYKWQKWLRLMGRSGSGKTAAMRTDRWANLNAARSFLGATDRFAAWNHVCFEDYMRHGFEPARDGGVQLAFRREVEARIHNTIPHDMQERLQKAPLRCPMGSVNGTRSKESYKVGTALTRKLSGRYWRWIEGTHLFPLERPVDTAKTVLRMLG